MFGRDGIEKEVPIGQVRSDPQPKRSALASFNEGGAIMRRVVDYDCQGIKITTKDARYKAYPGASLKIKDIIYRKGWEKMPEAEKGEKIL
jgi:hypothetical protein